MRALFITTTQEFIPNVLVYCKVLMHIVFKNGLKIILIRPSTARQLFPERLVFEFALFIKTRASYDQTRE